MYLPDLESVYLDCEHTDSVNQGLRNKLSSDHLAGASGLLSGSSWCALNSILPTPLDPGHHVAAVA